MTNNKDSNKEANKALRAVQLQLEEKMYNGGVDRWHGKQDEAIKSGEAASTDWNVKLTKHFIAPLSEGIAAYVEEQEVKKGTRSDLMYYMGCINPREAAFICIRQMLNAIAIRDSTSLQVISDDISSKIEDQVRFSKLRKTDKRTKAYLKKIEISLKRSSTRSYKHKRNVWANSELKVGADKWTAWTKASKLHLGSALIKLACEVITLNGDDVFYIDEIDISRGRLRKSSKVLGVRPVYAEWVSEFITNTEAFHPEVAPCVIPPRDWVSPVQGGFHTARVASRNQLIKSRDRETCALMTVSQMPKVYRAVNALQKTQWKVNTEVLDVLQEVCERGLELAVPSTVPLDKPLNPFETREDLKDLRGKELKEAVTAPEYDEFITWKRETRNWHDEERSRVSNVIDLARTRKIAEEYSEFDTIYFVYSLDFRGRVYTKASGLSPQGRDMQKGLLRFGRRKALGANGHYWLKIHGANLWAWDKEDFNTRIANVEEEEFLTMVKSIADNPIEDKSWVAADKPWQFLSWCFEFADFLEHCETGEAKDYESFIACAQDGSCSGIQHYSAMLRDEVGGRSVNLIDSDKPQDIYRDVVDIVYKRIEEDAKGRELVYSVDLAKETKIAEKNGVDLDTHLKERERLAIEQHEKERLFAVSWLAMGFDRDMTKKPVMTLPYGSSQLTCRDAIGEYIDEVQKKEHNLAKSEEREAILVHTFGDSRWEAEGYMSTLVWHSIGDVVVAARAGMAFIRKVARETSKQGFPLIWESETGFIIKQQIYKTTDHTVNTILFGRIQFRVCIDSDELDTRKMQSAAAPNFIHGSDAAHLILSVCEGLDRGIEDFWVVHDDFGTQACKTGHLHISLRVAMKDMYQEELLRKFLYFQEDSYDIELKLDKELPEYGNLDLNDILTSTYIFS